jgi:hypothetical protein
MRHRATTTGRAGRHWPARWLRQQENSMIFAITAVIVAYLVFHAGHSTGNYRHGRAAGRRGVGLMWYAGRGPWVSVPGPMGTRVGHRL